MTVLDLYDRHIRSLSPAEQLDLVALARVSEIQVIVLQELEL